MNKNTFIYLMDYGGTPNRVSRNPSGEKTALNIAGVLEALKL
jgi:hypothetical protein